jgi:hypothetical protein
MKSMIVSWPAVVKLRILYGLKTPAMNPMTTLSEVLENLKKEGYTTDFNLKNACLVCGENRLEISPGDFVVDRHYRFEGETDPGDAAILYAISSEKHNLRGTLVNGYGLYSDDISNEMMRALQPRQV